MRFKERNVGLGVATTRNNMSSKLFEFFLISLDVMRRSADST